MTSAHLDILKKICKRPDEFAGVRTLKRTNLNTVFHETDRKTNKARKRG